MFIYDHSLISLVQKEFSKVYPISMPEPAALEIAQLISMDYFLDLPLQQRSEELRKYLLLRWKMSLELMKCLELTASLYGWVRFNQYLHDFSPRSAEDNRFLMFYLQNANLPYSIKDLLINEITSKKHRYPFLPANCAGNLFHLLKDLSRDRNEDKDHPLCEAFDFVALYILGRDKFNEDYLLKLTQRMSWEFSLYDLCKTKYLLEITLSRSYEDFFDFDKTLIIKLHQLVVLGFDDFIRVSEAAGIPKEIYLETWSRRTRTKIDSLEK